MKQSIDTLAIWPMREADIEQIIKIESASFPRPWTRDHFLQELRSPHAFPLVAMISENVVAGYVCPMQLLDEGHILDIAVRPDCRGMGIGRLMAEKVLDECRKRGAEFVSLEVRPSNTAAISLYEGLGFVVTGRRKRYYENGEDAVLMEYRFDTCKELPDAV
ncbi:MAG: ribosomal protein S18-alanine N-acetyltransferase [Geobacter sp.]|nr:ribosomal protein S18-alanine N-acetyltransferase [Geobacter sp.]